MGGGKSYQGLPSSNPTTAYWQIPPSDIAEHRTTEELPSSADYVIIGSGVTGAGLALRLLDQISVENPTSTSTKLPHSTVLMLEARTTASGASGRNGGHCRAGWWGKFADFQSTFGTHEAVKFERFEEDTVNAVADFVRENKIDCDFKDVETADVLITDEDWEIAMKSWKLRHSYEEEFKLAPRKVLVGEEAVDYLQIPPAKGAVVFEAHTLNPYKLVVGIIKICLKKGLNLQTSTPVLSVKRMDEEEATGANLEPASNESGVGEEFPWVVKTEQGFVRAKKVILATNAYTNALYPSLADRRFLIPTRGQVLAVRPGDAISGNPALKRSAGIDGGVVGDYISSRAPGLKGEGDVIYGGGRRLSTTEELGVVDDSTIHPVIADYLRDAPPKYFGNEQWGKPGEVLREWTGIMGYTVDRYPLIGEAPGREGLWLAVGFNGHGMALSFRCTQALVSMMLGKDGGRWPEWLPHAFRVERAWEEDRKNLLTARNL